MTTVRVMRRTVVAVCAAMVLSACSASVPGRGEPAPGQTRAGPTRPTTASPTPAPPIGAGTVVESHRIAGAALLIGAVLAELTDNCSPSGPVVDPAETEGLDLGLFPPETAAPILRTYGFVAGWVYCRSAADVRATTVFLAELSDADSAAVASDEIAALLAVDGYEPAELADRPEALALIREDTAGVDGQDVSVLQALLPVDRMLVYLFHADLDTEQATTNATTVLTEQADLLADFEPTPQDGIAALNPDPFDLEGRAADPPGTLTNFSGSYDLDSYLRVAIAPEREREVLLDNGYVGTYVKQTGLEDGKSYQIVVYEMGSMGEADITFNEFRKIETEEFSGVRFTVPEDLTIPCFYFQVEDSGIYYQRCYTREGKYLGSIDVFGVMNPFDIAQIRMLNTAQIQAMRTG